MMVKVAMRDLFYGWDKWHKQYKEAKEEGDGMKQKFAKIIFAAQARSTFGSCLWRADVFCKLLLHSYITSNA